MYVTEAMTIRLCVNAIASLTTSANARDFRASRASRRRVPATRLLSNSLLNRLSPRWSPSPSARETPYGTTTRDASRGGREGGTGDLTAVEVETPRDRPRIACTRWCGTVCGEGIAWSRPRPWGDEGVSTLSPCTASRRCSPRLRTTARSPVEHARCRAGRGGGISRKAHRRPPGSGPSRVDGGRYRAKRVVDRTAQVYRARKGGRARDDARGAVETARGDRTFKRIATYFTR